MTTTSWKIGLSGNWNVGANWTSGVPTGTSDVFLDAIGNYTVTLTGSGLANSLTVESAGTVFNEKATGSLNIATAFTLDAGTALLHAANSITDGVSESGGVLETANSGALGSAAFTFSGGEFVGLLSETVANKFAMSGNITIAAADATVLNSNSTQAWALDATNPSSLVFGQGGNDGTIVWNTLAGSAIISPFHYSIEIAAGTLQGGDTSFSFLFDDANMTTIDAGARLDEHGFDNDIANLQGAGTIANTGAAAALFLFNSGDFSGVIQDDLSVEVESGSGMTLSGNNTYSGGTTIDSGDILQLGSGGTSGTVAGGIVDNGTLYYDRSGAIAQTTAISGAGAVTYQGGGTYTVNQAETYSGTTTLDNGELSFNNSSAFGTGDLAIVDGELLATTGATLALALITLDDNATVAAAHGQTLTLDATTQLSFTEETNSTLTFGEGANNGTVVLEAGGTSVSLSLAIDVHAGALKAGDGFALSAMLSEVSSTTVEAGATLNWGGFGGDVSNLLGAGSMVDSANAHIDVTDGNFSGVISGADSLETGGALVLSGVNTYSKGTTIDADATLSLGAGGTTGSIVGSIVDNGTLFIDRSNAFSETAAISGTGGLVQFGNGTTTIDRAESFSGGVTVAAGELSINTALAIGSGALSMQGGELLATASLSIGNTLDMSNADTFAAASGTVMNLNNNAANPWAMDDSGGAGSIVFGDGANNGTVVWHTPGGSNIIDANYTLEVQAGTLKAGDISFGVLTANATSTTVDSGAAINVFGGNVELVGLQGAGIVTNTSTAAVLDLVDSNFAGALNGALSANIFGSVALTGSGNMTGGFTLEGSAHLDLTNTWSQNVDFLGTASLVLHSPGQYSGTLSGFAAGDLIDVRGVDFNSGTFNDSYNSSNGVLTLSDGTHTHHVTLAGTYEQGNFMAASDGAGGTDITFVAVAEIPPHPLDAQGPMLASDHPPPPDFG